MSARRMAAPGAATVARRGRCGRPLTAAAALATGLLALGPLSAPAAAQNGPPGARGSQNPLPLAAARKATFTATEGTWMSVDVSPDGRTLVFDLLGDLYTLPIEGGKATRLLGGMAFEAQPRFSPDGTRVVFVSDRSGGDNVWVIHTDLTDTVQVTQGNTSLYVSPEWTPDGEHVVVSRSGGLGGAAKLQMIHVGRRAPLPLVTEPTQRKTVGAALTPDGRHIWYAGRTGDWQYNALLPQYQLYRYDRETGVSTLMTNRYGSAFRPAVSPDGRWLVYGTREGAETGLRRRDLATGAEDWLAYPVQRDEQESRAALDVLPGYAFTPDSRAVVVSYGGKLWRVPIEGGAASEIPFEAEVALDVGPEVKFAYAVDTAAAVTAKQIRGPVETPDGRRVVFTAFDRLWVKELPDGEARRLTDADVGEFHPRVSPDGRWVAYVTWDDEAGGHVMKARVDGSGEPVRLTAADAAALYSNPAWSPDGARVVASRGAARELKEQAGMFFGPIGGDFVWVPSEGGAVTRIAPSAGRDVAHFRADQPDRIYAYGLSEGLVSFRWDGTDVKPHLRVVGAPPVGVSTPHGGEPLFAPGRVFPVGTSPDPSSLDTEPGGPPPPAGLVLLSPTGERALAQVGSDLYAIDMPEASGHLTTVMVANPDAAPVPVRRLTDVGGEFPSWSPDGSRVHWSIGNALFTYDLARVEAERDSLEEVAHARALERVHALAVNDTLKTARAAADSLTKAGGEVPDSLKQRLVRLRADSVQAHATALLARADSMRAEAGKVAAVADSVRAGHDDLLADTTAGYEPDERRIEVTMPRDVPRGTVVLRGGRVLTMKGREVVERADVVVTDDRIVAVGPTGEVDVPEGARVVDVTGKTLLPGFVDTHYHSMWLVPEIHPEQVWQYLATLAYGVTTTRDPQTALTDVLSYEDRVATGGMVGPRVYSTGPGVFIGENLRDADHAKKVLARYAEYYDTKTLKMYMTGNRQQRQWIIAAAKELELMPTTEGGLDFKLELTHAIDGYPGIEHALPVAPIFSDVVELFKASQTTNTPTLLVAYGGPFGENFFYATEDVHGDEKLRRFLPEDNIDTRARRRGAGAGGSPGGAGWFLEEEHVFPRHAAFAKALVEDSARAAVGSHGQLQGLGYHWEMWAMGSGGMEPHDVLRAATVLGAEAVGLGGDLGTVESGKLADLLVLDGDPLADLRATLSIRYVMKNGRLYEADTLDEVWPRQRALPVPSFRSLAPAGVAAGVGVGPGGP